MEENLDTAQGATTVEQPLPEKPAEVTTAAPSKMKSAGEPKAVQLDGTRNPADRKEAEIVEGKDKPENTNPPEVGTEQQQQAAASSFAEDPAVQEYKALLEEHGVKTLAELKAKLAPQPDASKADKTPEEIEAGNRELDRKMLDIFTENGGTIEAYATLKNLASADADALRNLSHSELKTELLESGFTDEEAEGIIAERYTTMSEDDLEQLYDETDKEFAKRKNEFIKKKLESRGVRQQNKAKEYLDSLRNAVETQKLLGDKEKEFSSKVDEHLQALPKKVTLQLGKVNDLEVAPIDYNVSEEDIQEVAAILKDPSKRQQFFYNDDNSLNLKNITEVMLKARYVDNLAKVAFLEGGTRQVKVVESVFPMQSASSVGVGGSNSNNTGIKGKAARAGEPIPMNTVRRK